ncbi:MAG: TolC family protein [Parabacteroides sp.]|nr:TolC family protein [bacterium]MDY4102743.1 TolC family protein [Parabacteroides sp.]
MKKIIKIVCGLLLCPWLTMQGQKLQLSQEACRQMALAHNEDLQKADNALRQAELDKAVALAAFLPKVDGSLNGIYMSPDIEMSGMKLQMHGMYLAGVNVTQPLYTGGRLLAGRQLAGIGKESAELQLNQTRQQVLADADQAYWTLVSVQRKVRMLEAYERQMNALYDQVKLAVEAEMGTENELLRIRAKRSEIQYQLQKARNGSDLCRLALCNVLGAELDTRIEPTDTLIQVRMPQQLDDDISLRPELALLHKQIAAQQQQLKMTRAGILPTVGLSVGYSYYGNMKVVAAVGTENLHDGYFVAMASVSIPLFHWGENLKKIRRARYDIRNAELDLQKNSRLLSIEARQAVQNLTDGYTMVETAELGRKEAIENLRVMQERYDVSMCTLTDLLDAQTQWQQAESNFIEAQTQYKIYETEYKRTTGRL